MTTIDHYAEPWIITGMHRAGSSLVAAFMQSAGVNIGADLLGPAPGNPRGLFENREFVEFHKAMLRTAGWDELGWGPSETLRPSDAERNGGSALLARNAVDGPWGWKDPRTTIFLDFWFELAPGARFIFVYRSPWDVIDSLYRRGTDAILHEDPLLAVRMWQGYACRMLAFYARHPDRCLFCQAETINGHPGLFSVALNRTFGTSLSFPAGPEVGTEELQSVADAQFANGKQTTGNLLAGRAALFTTHFPETVETFRQMVAIEKRQIPSSPVSVPEPAPFPVRQTFQDWHDIRTLTRQADALRAELAAAWASRDELQFNYSTASSLLKACQIELAEYQRLLRQMVAKVKILQHRMRRQTERLKRPVSDARTKGIGWRWLRSSAPVVVENAAPLTTMVYSGRSDLAEGIRPLIAGLAELANRHKINPEVICRDDGALRRDFETHGMAVAIRDDAVYTRMSMSLDYDAAIQMLAAELAGRECDVLVAFSLRAFYAVEAASLIDIPVLWFLAGDEGPGDVESLQNMAAVIRARVVRCFGLPYRLVVAPHLIDPRCWPAESVPGNLVAMPAAGHAAEFIMRYVAESRGR